MNTLDAIAKRKSVRAYTSEQISEEALNTIIQAGFAAPVAMAMYESLHITVIQNEEILTRLADGASEFVFKTLGIRKNMDFGAKTIIVVSSTPVHRPGMEYANVGIVLENMVLAATDLGIGSVILGTPIVALAQNADLVKAIAVPEGFTPILGAAFGYAAEEGPVKAHTISVNRV